MPCDALDAGRGWRIFSGMSDALAPRPFLPLQDYAAPSLPAEETLRRFVSHARGAMSKGEDAPFIDHDHLRDAGDAMLDALAPAPACGPLRRDMDAGLDGWAAGPARWRKVVVLPPCDAENLIAGWAERHGHAIVPPPPRSDLMEPGDTVAASLDALDPSGRGVLVFPRLEEWFLRHRDGLDAVTRLLDWLSVAERSYLVGCSAWAWAFLSKAVEAEAALPAPVSPQAFDAPRLRDWFRDLAGEDGMPDHVFRMSSTGEDVFALKDDGTPKSDYLQTLAARSHGIPWVAWHLWRRSLRSGLDEEGEDVAEKEGRVMGEDTIWIAPVEDASIPDAPDRGALLILHALLIHGSLDRDELAAVLPVAGRFAVLPALVEAGMVRRDGDGRYACTAAGYPVVRRALVSAGFPVGRL